MKKATDLKVSKWLNAPEGYKADLKAPTIKVIHAFQMLCPGCVYAAIPQSLELYQHFQGEPVEILGLHTVFEHHSVMTPAALEVFIKEFRIPYPVGVDHLSAGQWMPDTMKAYDMQGTPTTLVIDHNGDVRLQHFGHIDTEKFVEFLKELINQAKAA